MSINGKQIADDILKTLYTRVEKLRQTGTTPTMGVILVGDDPGSASYVRQKEKAAERIGAKLFVSRQSSAVSHQTVQDIIDQWNDNPDIHGIIIQLPLPPHFDISINRSVKAEKDVDGFVTNSKFQVPVALAVEKILEVIYHAGSRSGIGKIPGSTYTNASVEGQARNDNLYRWLSRQNIVIIGRGKTAGKPIDYHFQKLGCHPFVIHSQTTEDGKNQALKKADIIISCVGKEQVITADMVKKGVILISVGIWRDREGKLHGDYEGEEVKDIASFYTPTPGGVGPVNVACLMENLVSAATKV